MTSPEKTAEEEALQQQPSNEVEIESSESETEDAPAAAGTTAATAKQKKKKKSKAAAKLRKKLGLQSQASGSTADEPSQKASTLSDEDVKQLQQAIVREQGPQAASLADRATLEKLMKMMNLERAHTLKDAEAKQKQYKSLAEHKFWKTQPVTKPSDKPIEQEGPIEPNVSREQVRQEPYPLPKDFAWSPIDIDDEGELKEVYDLLSANYVEDVDSSLRFNYSPEFLHWVLKHPGYHKTWHVGVRVESTRKLVAFISAIPHELRVRQQAYPSAEVNFLCVHKKLRSKRLAPVLIKEVTRQCHLTGIFQAIYTGGIVIPTPIACARYYHRTINAEKLLAIGFSGVRPGMTREAFIKQYDLPDQTRIAGLRQIEERDIPSVAKLMRRYLRRFDMAARFTNEEVAHLLLSGKSGERKKQVTWTYVVERGDGTISDMISFYSLPSSVLDSEQHSILEAAYLFYYATDAGFDERSSQSQVPPSQPESNLHKTNLSKVEQEDEKDVLGWAEESKETKAKIKSRLNELVFDILILAKKQGFDVLNCLTVMDNPLFLNEQLFGPGDGFLRHYLFNWRIRPVAGGMGARPGEAELDPVVQFNKQVIEAEAKASSSSMTQADKIRRLTALHPRPEMGSGTGIVMV